MLHPLPLPSVEQLARGLEPVDVAAGQVVFTQGDVGDRYYVIESGEAEVVGDGRVVATLGPGEGFGEIALLRRTRRTATVRAAATSGCGRCAPTASCPSSSATRRAPARRDGRRGDARPLHAPSTEEPPREPQPPGRRSVPDAFDSAWHPVVGA